MRIHLPPTLVEPHSLLQIHPRGQEHHPDLLCNPPSGVHLSPSLLQQDHSLLHPQSSQITSDKLITSIAAKVTSVVLLEIFLAFNILIYFFSHKELLKYMKNSKQQLILSNIRGVGFTIYYFYLHKHEKK